MSRYIIPRRALTPLLLLFIVAVLACAKRQEVVPPGGPSEDVLVEEEQVTVEPTGTVEGLDEPGLSEEALAASRARRSAVELEDVRFEFDRYNLTPEARRVLKGNWAVLRTMPEAEVLVEGHCDERGTVEYNLALGQKRAEAVRDYLVSLGMEPARIDTISFGEERPLDPRHNEEAWARNRRAHLVLLER